MRPPIYEPKGRAREYAPLALNLWNTCVHGCKYCYVPQWLHKKPESFHVAASPRKGVLTAVRDQLKKDVDSNQPEICGGDRRVLLCFTCDPYQPHENGFTRQVLELLVEYNVPWQVLTKGGMRAARDFDLYAGGAGTFGTSLCFTDDVTRREWEPNAGFIHSRILAIKQAHDAGIYTWLSIEPVIHHGQALALFAQYALATLQVSDCKWRIKDDLYKYLPPGSPQSSNLSSQQA